uniref:Uncharacterized protein n=1 Tax=Rhabditophanes sp. KR3021 TaxID=114890 RepID=A0AC35TQN4_9BILA
MARVFNLTTSVLLFVGLAALFSNTFAYKANNQEAQLYDVDEFYSKLFHQLPPINRLMDKRRVMPKDGYLLRFGRANVQNEDFQLQNFPDLPVFRFG